MGATKPIDVNVRILSATNINIKNAIKSKEFREDLYFRLGGFVLNIKELAMRPGDIEPLARIFIQKHSNDSHIVICRNAVKKLLSHHWPGNVRELENVILRAIILSDSNEIFEQHITFDEFPDDARETSSLQTNLTDIQTDNVLPFNTISKLSDLRSDSELNEILNALKMNSTRDRAAKELGISPRTLRQKLNDFRKAGLPVPGPYART